MLEDELGDHGGDTYETTRLSTRSTNEKFGKEILPITHRDENVPLHSNGPNRRTQEKIRDPNPRPNGSIFPAGFEVAITDLLNLSEDLVKLNGVPQELIHSNGSHKTRKDLNDDEKRKLDVFTT